MELPNEPLNTRSEAANLAQLPDTSPEVLAELARHPQTMVRYYVSWNRHAAPETLAALASDKYMWTRERVASRRDTPIATLIDLAQDRRLEVRKGVTANPSTPPLVKLYLQSGDYSGMTLQEFLEAARD